MSTAAHIAEVLAGRKIRAHGRNYLVPCPAHDDDSPSLSLCDGDRGLIVHCFAGCAASDVFVAIRRVDRGLLQPEQTAHEPVKGGSEYERRQHEKAVWLWGRSKPIGGTIAETYLRAARGITCPLPATLAFLPPLKPEHHPAMIAAFVIVDEPEPGVLGNPRDVCSVHLTLLKPDGSGKASAKPDKLIIGSPAIKIGKDVRGIPMILAPPNDSLGMAVTEGIEDGLSVHQATGLGVWAAGAAGFMPKLVKVIPDFIGAVTIFAHADKAGQDGACKLATTLQCRNIEVTIEGLAP